MKVNLLVNNPAGVRQGYYNIDPAATLDDPHQRTPSALDDFSSFVEANEVSELLALDILQRFPLEGAKKAFSFWASRIRHQGTLTVSFYSAIILAERLCSGAISIEEFSRLAILDRKCALSTELVRSWAETIGAGGSSGFSLGHSLVGQDGYCVLSFNRN